MLAKERCRAGHFWVTVAPDKHVLYEYSKRHDGAAVDELLPATPGYLVADAHAVYDHLYNGAVIEVGCWAHARRYFFKALESDPERAKTALAQIGALFALERRWRARRQRSGARSARPGLLRSSTPSLRGAIKSRRACSTNPPWPRRFGTRATSAWRFVAFSMTAACRMHNNISELNLRRQVVGRKNWLFVGSDDGGDVNTIFVSLLASCRLHKIEPLAYMRDLLCLLPRWPRHRVLELAPAYWRETLEQRETQQTLDANVFRRVVLGLPVGSANRPPELPRQPAHAASDG